MSFIAKHFSRLYVQKILSSILILVLLVPSVFMAIPAQKAEAFGWLTFDISNFFQNTITAASTPVSATSNVVSATQQTAFNLKVFLLDGIATALARGIIQQITAQTVNWINSGFDGNPAYVTDPQQFFQDVGDRTVVSALGNNAGTIGGKILGHICSPFQPQIRLALVQQYLQQDQLGQCSIQSSIKNYDAFIQNFENGGWDGWFSITQNSQNNPYGAYLGAQNELTLQISNQNQIYRDQLTQGKGFLSFQRCSGAGKVTAQDLYDNRQLIENGTLPAEKDALAGKQIGDCIGNKETVTPGSVIESQLESHLGSGVRQLELTNSINQVVSALMVQGVKAVFGGIKDGLRGLSESSPSQTSLTSQLLAGSEQTKSQNADTLSRIQGSVPSSIREYVNTSGGAFNPTIDDQAIADEINKQADAGAAKAKAQAQSESGQPDATGTTGTSTPPTGDGTGTQPATTTPSITTAQQDALTMHTAYTNLNVNNSATCKLLGSCPKTYTDYCLQQLADFNMNNKRAYDPSFCNL